MLFRSGQPAPDFQLTDIEGVAHRLSQYRGKIVVLEWVNPGCPVVQRHYDTGNMQKTQRAAVASGVVWLSINSGGPKAQGDLSNEAAAAWQDINKEYADKWPNITAKGETPADADEWKGKPDKKQLLSQNPGSNA